jgi:integrase
VFAQLCREGARTDNPVTAATMPRFPREVFKERSVLTDPELALYLAWEHPEARRRGAVRERQVMACMSRMFGGLRTGDLHALRWEAFNTLAGAFTCGYAPRQKTRRPQLLEIPEPLRPFLREWWELAGKPSEGVVFPVRRVGKRGDRVGHTRTAGAPRRGGVSPRTTWTVSS